MKRTLVGCVNWITLFLFMGCAQFPNGSSDYEEAKKMLSVLTSIAQASLEDGYFKNGEQSALEYIAERKPKIVDWFTERGYRIRMADIADHAVVMICKGDKPIFEDTSCINKNPDIDHRSNLNVTGCNITMTKEMVRGICR